MGAEGREDDDRSWFDACGRTVEFELIVGIAEAMRGEFGVSIDAHPGGEGGEAGTVNRAFRTATRRILSEVVTPEDDLPSVLSRALRRAAHLRLAQLGVEARRAEDLLDSEPGFGDRWPAYLALAPARVIDDMLDPESS